MERAKQGEVLKVGKERAGKGRKGKKKRRQMDEEQYSIGHEEEGITGKVEKI